MTEPTDRTAHCSTPDKRRYATVAAAEKAAERSLLAIGPLKPYTTCPCGWVHLSAHNAAQLAPTKQQYEAARAGVIALEPGDFARLITEDALGRATQAHAAALRHPDVVRRWQLGLKELRIDLAEQFKARVDDRSRTASDWRRRAAHLRAATEVRRGEAGELVRQYQDMGVFVADKAARQDKRGQAGDVAVRRLIEAHREEFHRYLLAACRDIDVEPPPNVLAGATPTEAGGP